MTIALVLFCQILFCVPSFKTKTYSTVDWHADLIRILQAAGTKEASMEINQSMNGMENKNQVEQISPDANNLNDCTF